eukprot:CAMPEP_0183358602 /NCGR_PEP_ID=MMETSP0164_2-20130417/49756_1 /TAXON_ID=221442 /ORGANISM="Coccolithus pelagicus ssp braarudi, Strain PLY182g" /LENGTH=156 /DNA_ID=CAMNT_0025532527 /DNA_START=168 /DNA_END=638 /DNA_ORIENTATION=+
MVKYQCRVCKHAWQQVPPFRASQGAAAAARTYACAFCDAVFKANAGLERHIINKHVSTGVFACSECDLRFTLRDVRDKHQQFCTHSGARSGGTRLAKVEVIEAGEPLPPFEASILCAVSLFPCAAPGVEGGIPALMLPPGEMLDVTVSELAEEFFL